MKIMEILKEMIAFMRMMSVGNKRFVPVLIGGGFANAVMPFISLYFSAQILNNVIAGEYALCMEYVIAMLVSQLLIGMLGRGAEQYVQGMQETGAERVKARVAKKAFVLEYEEFEKQEIFKEIQKADIAGISIGGIGAEVATCYILVEKAWAILFTMGYIVQLFFQVDSGKQNFFTSNISLIVLVLAYALSLWAHMKLNAKTAEMWKKQMEKNTFLNTLGHRVTKAFTDEKNAADIRVYQLQEMLFAKKEKLEGATMRSFLKGTIEREKYTFWINFIYQFTTGIAYFLVGARALYGVIGVGDVLLYTGALNLGISNIRLFWGNILDFVYIKENLGAYDKFLQRSDMAYDGTLPIEKRDDARYEFEFHDVSFAYPGTTEMVLEHVNLKFQIGEKLALVGRNGAGKTTLVKLLCRLYEPTEGKITLNGIDIWKYNYQEYTKAFSVVFQDFALFSMPLDENVASGETVDEKQLWHVLEQVGLKERVTSMENGIRTQLYNNNGAGVDISGGEAQRLAIARALYKDGPFVILDEPTAALDPIAEAEIYENFNSMIANKTALYISHRMSSCKFCDRIVVLDYGKIAESGTHEQLLAYGGIYASLYATQAQYYA